MSTKYKLYTWIFSFICFLFFHQTFRVLSFLISSKKKNHRFDHTRVMQKPFTFRLLVDTFEKTETQIITHGEHTFEYSFGDCSKPEPCIPVFFQRLHIFQYRLLSVRYSLVHSFTVQLIFVQIPIQYNTSEVFPVAKLLKVNNIFQYLYSWIQKSNTYAFYLGCSYGAIEHSIKWLNK